MYPQITYLGHRLLGGSSGAILRKWNIPITAVCYQLLKILWCFITELIVFFFTWYFVPLNQLVTQTLFLVDKQAQIEAVISSYFA